jgi:hypothetical protein
VLRAVLAGIAFAAAIGLAAQQDAAAPRLPDGGLPSVIPPALGGGEVVLELAINAQGAVQRLDRPRAPGTPGTMFAYTLFGFRAPLGPASAPPRR